MNFLICREMRQALLLALNMVVATSTVAQDSRNVQALELKQDPAIGAGKIAVELGTADQRGVRFSVSGLTILQPVIVAVRSDDITRRLRIELSKYSWNQPERSSATGADGIYQFLIKTQGDLNIWLKSETGPAGYSLVVWAGDEVMQPLPSPFVPFSSQSRPKTDSQGSPRGSHPGLPSAGVLIPVLGIFRSVRAHEKRARYRAQGGNSKNVVRWILVLLLCPALVSTSVAQEIEILKTVHEQKEFWAKKLELGLKTQDALQKNLDKLKKAVPLTKADASAQENYNTPGAPRMPSHCSDAPPGKSVNVAGWEVYIEGCKECYSKAVGGLNRVRRNLERLRAMGAVNKATYDFAMAAGEGMASLEDAGLYWPIAKHQIDEGQKVFDDAYDKKYGELMKSLGVALRDVSDCEEKFFHEQDWYERFGYIYEAFMAEHYRRQ